MIHDFLFVLNNGLKTRVGEYIPSVPILEQINNPAFHPRAYEWENDGQTHTRVIDGNTTLTARPLPGGTGVVVLQSAQVYGADNVLILDSTNEPRQRIVNPYQNSRFFIMGDKFWFDAVKVGTEDVVLNIQVHRKLAGKPYDAAPIYEATYDPVTWSLRKLEWRPAT